MLKFFWTASELAFLFFFLLLTAISTANYSYLFSWCLSHITHPSCQPWTLSAHLISWMLSTCSLWVTLVKTNWPTCLLLFCSGFHAGKSNDECWECRICFSLRMCENLCMSALQVTMLLCSTSLLRVLIKSWQMLRWGRSLCKGNVLCKCMHTMAIRLHRVVIHRCEQTEVKKSYCKKEERK